MRIITWNLRFENKKALKTVDVALARNPDILCLQEVSQTVLDYLLKIAGYSIHASYDFISKNPKRHGYTVILSKYPVTEEKEIPYDEQISRSLLDSVVYRFMHKQIEQHNAILITVDTPFGIIRVLNTRLSCAMSTRDRLAEFYSLISHVPKDIPVIYCGDYNVVDSALFNRLTGWIRGFTKYDYHIDEREAFETLFRHLQCTNIFKGISTSVSGLPLLQFDHILVPESMQVIQKEAMDHRYGSDHKMLMADIALP